MSPAPCEYCGAGATKRTRFSLAAKVRRRSSPSPTVRLGSCANCRRRKSAVARISSVASARSCPAAQLRLAMRTAPIDAVMNKRQDHDRDQQFDEREAAAAIVCSSVSATIHEPLSSCSSLTVLRSMLRSLSPFGQVTVTVT